jgi:hypothetical protein
MIGGNRTRAAPTGRGWSGQFITALKHDPKRSWLLTFLLVVLILAWAKTLIGVHGPSDAEAAARATAQSDIPVLEPVPPGHRSSPRQSLADWARQPVGELNRNLFTAPLDDYPPDPSRPAPAPTSAITAAKSAAAKADEEKQALLKETEDLTLEGTVLGARPGAWINGVFVGLGQVVGATHFRVDEVQQGRIFLASGKLRVALSMK